ncbi:unnamed protein product [Auanema sp. JU1783]|nr:unnamed protein product [Auanema sp. JU1783]
MRFSVKQLAVKWDVFSSVVLTRYPVIAPPMTPIEHRYLTSQLDIERERSLLSDFELKTKKDEALLEQRAALEREGKELSELDGEIGITNSMKIDDWNKKSSAFEKQFHLHNPKHYEVNDEKSLRRCLDEKLVLIVKQKFGDSSYASPWVLPQTKHREGESLRQTAERCLGDISNGNFQASIESNAPFSVHSYKYPKPLAKKLNADGAKLFFYAAALHPKSPFDINKNEVSDLKWANADEFWSIVPGRKYKEAVQTAFLK